MNLHGIMTRTLKLAADNSPAILTALGVTGTITTAYLTGKASHEMAILQGRPLEVLSDLTTYENRKDELKHNVRLYWRLYIPAAGCGLLTVGCIVGANRIGTRRTAAMAAAYTLSERAYAEYKDKVVEKLGEKKEEKIRDEIAQDQVNRNPASTREIIITGGGDVLCYDSVSGRYFKNTMEALRKAQNDINEKILNSMFMYVNQNDFYDLIGLPRTEYFDEVGWNVDHTLELNFSAVFADNGEPCLSITYRAWPIRDYNHLQC